MGKPYIEPETLIARVPESGCWLWEGCLTHDGYPTKGKKYMHRVMYEKYVGPIPEGLTLDHVCRVRSCCNPAHMEPMTLRDNIARGDYGWRKRITHCKQGHEYTPENTYFNPKGGRNGGGKRSCRACGNLATKSYLARKKEH